MPLTEQAKQQAQKVVQQTQQKTGAALEQARDQVRTRVTTQKDMAADGLENVALAVRQTSQHLRDQPQGALGGYAESAASAVENFAGYLRRTEVDEAVVQVERFARSQPVLFLGSVFALGFLAARFFKSSGQSGSTTIGSNGAAMLPAPQSADPLLPVPVYDDPTGAEGYDVASVSAGIDDAASLDDDETLEVRATDDASSTAAY